MKGTKKIKITKVSAGLSIEQQDYLAIEEPLEIIIQYPEAEKWIEKTISITMRTPGNDNLLAVGFLMTEGIIKNGDAIESIEHKKDVLQRDDPNRILVKLSNESKVDLAKLERHFYTTSSCGVCGKTSIDAVKTKSEFKISAELPTFSTKIVGKLPTILANNQKIFESTGGIHAAALFEIDGSYIDAQEDVGRHNALDKLIGQRLLQNQLPLSDKILLVSGRASFELIQKATMAGIPIFIAVGAPSSLAIELAESSNITLIGFAKQNGFNIYTHPEKVL